MQTAFFNQIKNRLPQHMALVDVVAELLNMSTDSAYRRIRGEKELCFSELQKLSTHFGISLDQFFQINGNALHFNGNFIRSEGFDFKNYLQGIVAQLSYFVAAQQKELYYLNKDIPIFHHFMFPELAAFKCYFWSRYNLNYSQYNKGQFLIDDFIDVFNEYGKKIAALYLQIPSTEIWNLDCINTTIRQINYYRESKVFQSHQDIITVFNCLEKLVDHIEKQVELGKKFPHGKPQEADACYRVFINEFILGDNTIAVMLDGVKMVFLNHNIINYIQTTDNGFADYTFHTLNTLMKKSTLISEIGEKDRENFFNDLRKRISTTKRLTLSDK